MRLSRRLLAELRSNYEYKHPWLQTLKLTRLTDLAQATGIRSAGPKPALCERLDREFQKWDQQGSTRVADQGCLESNGSNNNNADGLGSLSSGLRTQSTLDVDFHRGLSILSIDMGIKNLAYAHLVVPGIKMDHGRRRHASKQKQQQERKGTEAEEHPLPILNAWRRIDVSRLPSDFAALSATAIATTEVKKEKKKHANKSLPCSPEHTSSTLVDSMVKEDEETANENSSNSTPTPIEDEEFYPLALAPRAYTIVTELLDAYKPTHVLIERQRTRSSGGSSVLESTLRVGVFEGMLYSIFLTLARERPWMTAPVVVPVEPQRVARFLAQKCEEDVQGYRIRSIETEGEESVDAKKDEKEGTGSADENNNKNEKRKRKRKGKEKEKEEQKNSETLLLPEKTKTPKLNNRQTKIMKIDLAGLWLASTHQSHHSGFDASPVSTIVDNSAVFVSQSKLEIAPDGLLHRWVDAYLNKWPGLGKGSSRRRSPKRKVLDRKTLHEDEVLREVPKLDDLADSLVQGVTWLDWMRMRQHVVREGESMLVLNDGKPKKKE
ncbi:uncharacterized protein KD926_005375 [Aspergillus affinis]|uniref:uncharacterized protein n=1 Tax=Aspergillus affinis TaxID=1070780 RepID=UPI0022FEF5B1|nr:ribonuclease H-like protein [Aspergillus affinis]KAI9042521.1 ribonuclease H-like protein [Aspergillus affinis]